jgi:hypothetical protein
MDDEFAPVTVMVRGLSVKEIIEKLGGMGRDKPIRAISFSDVFAECAEYKKYAEFFVDRCCQNCKDDWADMIEMEMQEEKENQDAR